MCVEFIFSRGMLSILLTSARRNNYQKTKKKTKKKKKKKKTKKREKKRFKMGQREGRYHVSGDHV